MLDLQRWDCVKNYSMNSIYTFDDNSLVIDSSWINCKDVKAKRVSNNSEIDRKNLFFLPQSLRRAKPVHPL